MNLKLNKEAQEKIDSLRDLHKSRGFKVKDWCEIISSILLDVKDTSWEEKIEEFTPKDFLFNEALKDPDLEEKIHKLIIKEKKTAAKKRNDGRSLQ